MAVKIPKTLKDLIHSDPQLQQIEDLLNALQTMRVDITIPARVIAGIGTVPAETLTGTIRIAGATAVIDIR